MSSSNAVSILGPSKDTGFDFRAHLARQRAFSEKTFGPDYGAAAVVDHIRKELIEVEANPTDLSEWMDVTLLSLDGAWRAGYSPDEIIAGLVAKLDRNERRVWPDWRTAPKDRAIEHDRGVESAPAARIDPMQNPDRPSYFIGNAADEHPAERALRRLACWLGVGGYNAPTVDAEAFERKIRAGIEQLQGGGAASAAARPTGTERGEA